MCCWYGHGNTSGRLPTRTAETRGLRPRHENLEIHNGLFDSRDMSKEEWLIFLRSQYVLKRYREISQMFVDGLVLARNFSNAQIDEDWPSTWTARTDTCATWKPSARAGSCVRRVSARGLQHFDRKMDCHASPEITKSQARHCKKSSTRQSMHLLSNASIRNKDNGMDPSPSTAVCRG